MNWDGRCGSRELVGAGHLVVRAASSPGVLAAKNFRRIPTYAITTRAPLLSYMYPRQAL